MGTNYYHRTDICECCNRYKEKHIGKSSAGWQFSFQGYRDYKDQPKIESFQDWKRELLADGKIFDEYGREFSFHEFCELVESKQSQPNNHYDCCAASSVAVGYDMSQDWKDEEGYSFSSSEFS